MLDAELELETELEDLMTVLSESELESEARWEAQDAGHHVPPGRCTPIATRVGSFVCSPWDIVKVTTLLGVAVAPATLRAAVEAAAAGAASLASTAANSLDILHRTRVSRVAFCAAFGVAPDFVPPWRATLHGAVKWRDIGELVAIRLRDVAKILDGGCIRYFCWGSPAHCPECHKDPPDYFACSSFRGQYLICLGPGFWQAWQASDTVTTDLTLLHEALHIYFRRTVSHNGRTGNAFCYESYATRINGLPVPQVTTLACPTGACAPLPPTILDGFGIDKAKLQPFHTPLINQVAHAVVDSWKTTSPIQIVQLMGFTDTTGPVNHNFDLGQRRALAAQKGIADAIRALDPAVAGRVTFIPITRGAQGPIAPNNTVAGRRQNRRVEVTLLPG
jgi:hypothetical protein